MAKATGFYRGNKAYGLTERHQFHLVLDADDHDKLQKLTYAMQMSAADVVRTLLRSKRVPKKGCR